MADAVEQPVVFITGGAGGIGTATGKAFADAGYAVVVTDIDVDRAKATAAVLEADGASAIGLGQDVTSTASTDAAVAAAVERYGRLDALVNNAGTIDPGPSEEVTDEAWSRLLSVHLDGTFRTSRAAYPALADGGGAIVNISSVAAHVGLVRRLSYSAAKSALEGMARTLAVEWADAGIRVNAVAPGYTRTELYEHVTSTGLVDMNRMLARVPMHRPGETSEVAAAILFLASPAASYVTGQTLVVDGGLVVSTDW
jgi:NAD(P)-dependent dehydrogenase (short-subunit alcohol dehydrogenase family)